MSNKYNQHIIMDNILKLKTFAVDLSMIKMFCIINFGTRQRTRFKSRILNFPIILPYYFLASKTPEQVFSTAETLYGFNYVF